MAQAFALTESDDEFLASASNRFVHVLDIPAPPSQVWAALIADDALVSWSGLVTGMQWTTPRPFGVGTRRVVTLGRIAALTERFYRWEDQRRMTFTVDFASIPGLRRFAEDIELASTATGTRLTWTFAVEGKPVLQLLLRSTSAVTERITGSIAKGIVGRVAATVPTAGE
ncbi:SRPBCC family protein [Nocardia sp. XZ_19_231]|uniref:SRPBCC family protein n=1 Tax=Nocardia sp. XZ_19_231 TaxID=2769252 RepID=UPI00188EA7BB|nr:SRPBCC family protein [Nocardia sp. XZ_19_231]